MPRRQKTEYYYTCGHCDRGDTSMSLHLSTIGVGALAGAGWTLLLHGDEWFCNTGCFIDWLAGKISEAMRTAVGDDRCYDGTEDFTDREDAYYAGFAHEEGNPR